MSERMTDEHWRNIQRDYPDLERPRQPRKDIQLLIHEVRAKDTEIAALKAEVYSAKFTWPCGHRPGFLPADEDSECPVCEESDALKAEVARLRAAISRLRSDLVRHAAYAKECTSYGYQQEVANLTRIANAALAPNESGMSREQVQAELARLGIDMKPGYQRVQEALDRARLRKRAESQGQEEKP